MFLPGAVALWVALIALVASTYLYYRSLRGDERSRGLARQAYGLATFAVLVAAAALLYLLLAHDFRVNYVYSYSDRGLSAAYLISSFWAGQEGSFLLWLGAGMLIGLPLIRYARHYEDRTLLVYNLAQLSLLVILLRQSPFSFLAGADAGQVPTDGQGLNPLLQNPWMTIHPPIMFIGYAATAAPFAFAIAALWSRRYDEWVKASLPWALLSVVTLGAAILLGGYWAYVTLGWGGYWGWDPVENSSLVPWLSSAALVHGMLLQKARGRFRKLNFSLAILSYVLVVYATFLTRSGVLADFSVHSFVDLGITGWLVANLTVFVVLGAGMLLWRWREIPTQAGDEKLFSRTVFLILAIAALVATAAMVLLGTSAPLITRLASKPSQVGPAFYNRVTLPVGILAAFLVAIVPYLGWRGMLEKARLQLGAAAALAAGGTVAAFLLGGHGVLYLLFLFVALFAAFSNAFRSWEKARERKLASAGDHLAHVGLALMLVGIVTSSAWDRSEKLVLPLGESKQALGYTLTFKGVDKPTPAARDAMLVEVKDASGRVFTARPRMFRNEKSNQMVANPDVRAHLTHDVYISPIEFEPGRPPEAGDTIEIGKGEQRMIGPLRVTFEAFDMGDHSGGGRITMGAKLQVEVGGTRSQLTPVMSAGHQSFEASTVAVPGLPGVTLQIAGVNASAGRIRLKVTGLGGGIAKRAVLHQGETLNFNGVALTFDGFDMSQFEPEQGKINIGAVMKLGSGGVIKPRVRGTGEVTEDVAVPGLPGVQLRITGMNAEEKSVEVALLDPKAPADQGEPARLSADISIKPMISVLWVGLAVLLAGGVMAVVRRAADFSSAVGATPGDVAPSE